MSKPVVVLTADPECRNCRGRGEVYDFVPVPFGHGNCRMPSDCDCIYDDIDEETMQKIFNGEVEVKVISTEKVYNEDREER